MLADVTYIELRSVLAVTGETFRQKRDTSLKRNENEQEHACK